MLGESRDSLRMKTDAVVARLTGRLQQNSSTTLGILRDDASPISAETPSAHRVQQLTIASDKVKCRLPVGRFAENAKNRRAHLFGEVV